MSKGSSENGTRQPREKWWSPWRPGKKDRNTFILDEANDAIDDGPTRKAGAMALEDAGSKELVPLRKGGTRVNGSDIEDEMGRVRDENYKQHTEQRSEVDGEEEALDKEREENDKGQLKVHESEDVVERKLDKQFNKTIEEEWAQAMFSFAKAKSELVEALICLFAAYANPRIFAMYFFGRSRVAQTIDQATMTLKCTLKEAIGRWNEAARVAYESLKQASEGDNIDNRIVGQVSDEIFGLPTSDFVKLKQVRELPVAVHRRIVSISFLVNTRFLELGDLATRTLKRALEDGSRQWTDATRTACSLLKEAIKTLEEDEEEESSENTTKNKNRKTLEERVEDKSIALTPAKRELVETLNRGLEAYESLSSEGKRVGITTKNELIQASTRALELLEAYESVKQASQNTTGLEAKDQHLEEDASLRKALIVNQSIVLNHFVARSKIVAEIALRSVKKLKRAFADGIRQLNYAGRVAYESLLDESDSDYINARATSDDVTRALKGALEAYESFKRASLELPKSIAKDKRVDEGDLHQEELANEMGSLRGLEEQVWADYGTFENSALSAVKKALERYQSLVPAALNSTWSEATNQHADEKATPTEAMADETDRSRELKEQVVAEIFALRFAHSALEALELVLEAYVGPDAQI